MSSTDLRHREFQRILLIKPSSLGDVIHALPVLHGLRTRYPQAHIAWLISRSFAPIIARHPELDELIVFDRNQFARLGRSPGATRAFFTFVRALRRRRFDLVVDLQGLFRSGFFARATGAPVRLGLREARELAWLAYTHRIPRGGPDVHAVERNYAVARWLGFEDVPVTMNLAISPAERADARTLLADAGVPAGRPFVAILPGARWETKRWLPQRFAALVEWVASESGVEAVLMGGPDERDACTQIMALATGWAANLAGQTSLRQLAAVIAEAAVVVCHDSGPMHIAAALQRPMVAISGPTNPSRTGPYRQVDAVLRRDLPCSPCYLRRLSQCPHAHECMQGIEADAVISRVARTLEASAASTDR